MEDFEVIKNYDLIVLGTPVHAFNIPLTVRLNLNSIFKMNLSDKKVILFSTCGLADCRNMAINELTKLLRETSVDVVGSIGIVRTQDSDIDKIVNINITKEIF